MVWNFQKNLMRVAWLEDAPGSDCSISIHVTLKFGLDPELSSTRKLIRQTTVFGL